MRLLTGLMAATAMVAVSAHSASAIPVSAPVYSWTGLYAGVQGGYNWGAFGGSANVLPSGPNIPVRDFPLNGAAFGAHIGYNVTVFSNWVKGFEADFDWTGMNGSNAPAGVGGASDTVNVNMQGSVRGRVGYAWGNFLLYGTAGVAAAAVHHTVRLVTPPYSPSDSNSGAFGWTAGLGVEWAIHSAWSATLEYRYTSLTGRSEISPAGALAGEHFPYHVTEQAIRAGFSYHFDAPPP